jgi:hypothetical protein
MFKRFGLAALVAGAIWLSGPCATSAATVTPESGAVLVNSGKGFIKVSSDVEYRPGARVMVRPGGSAVIGYGSGCSVRVKPGRIETIRDTPPCDLALGLDCSGVSMKDAPTECASGLAGQVSEFDLAIGGAALAAGVGVAVGLSEAQGGGDFIPVEAASP